MRAVGFRQSHPVDHPEALVDLDLPDPRDLLVEVRAVSVNPVDVWMRMSSRPEPGEPVVLGWDAAGVVRAVGPETSLFRVGEPVWYSGSFRRQGSDAELQCVHEHLVARMPESLDFAAAAALPLTAITAWELLFERLGIEQGGASAGQSLLVSGAGGGMGPSSSSSRAG